MRANGSGFRRSDTGSQTQCFTRSNDTHLREPWHATTLPRINMGLRAKVIDAASPERLTSLLTRKLAR